MNAMLYTTHVLEAPRATLNPGGKYGPFAVVTLGLRLEVTSHDPAELDAIAAEFTSAAAMLREALAGKQGTDA